VVQRRYRVGVPEGRFYREILNTDEARFGGTGVTNAPGRQAIPMPWQSQPCHVEVTLPPLGVIYLKPER
jgi:1,4-alpha-glucan branching enzyme